MCAHSVSALCSGLGCGRRVWEGCVCVSLSPWHQRGCARLSELDAVDCCSAWNLSTDGKQSSGMEPGSFQVVRLEKDPARDRHGQLVPGNSMWQAVLLLPEPLCQRFLMSSLLANTLWRWVRREALGSAGTGCLAVRAFPEGRGKCAGSPGEAHFLLVAPLPSGWATVHPVPPSQWAQDQRAIPYCFPRHIKITGIVSIAGPWPARSPGVGPEAEGLLTAGSGILKPSQALWSCVL